MGLRAAAQPGRIRAVALELQQAVADDPDHADAILRRTLRHSRALHSRERRLVAEGVYDLIRHRGLVDRVASIDGSRSDAPLARWLGWLVVLGLPPEEAGARWSEHSQRPGPDFNALAELEQRAVEALTGLAAEDAAAMVASVPVGLARSLVQDLGLDVGPFLAASNRRAPLGLRVNATRASRDEVAERLLREGVVTRPSRWAPNGLISDRLVDLNRVPSFRDGWVEVQDEGSQLVVALAVAAAGDAARVVDWCAGAGGKTLALAAAWPAARIVALDTRSRALDELVRRARRARVASRIDVERLEPDGRVPPSVLARTAESDLVLVDAPCSGSGTLRRHPEHRLRYGPTRLAAFPKVQAGILSAASRAVRARGWLVYATCSVLADENERVVERFLEAHPGFRQVDAASVWPEAAELGDGSHLRVGPHQHGTDGFFAALLQRR